MHHLLAQLELRNGKYLLLYKNKTQNTYSVLFSLLSIIVYTVIQERKAAQNYGRYS